MDANGAIPFPRNRPCGRVGEAALLDRSTSYVPGPGPWELGPIAAVRALPMVKRGEDICTASKQRSAPRIVIGSRASSIGGLGCSATPNLIVGTLGTGGFLSTETGAAVVPFLCGNRSVFWKYTVRGRGSIADSAVDRLCKTVCGCGCSSPATTHGLTILQPPTELSVLFGASRRLRLSGSRKCVTTPYRLYYVFSADSPSSLNRPQVEKYMTQGTLVDQRTIGMDGSQAQETL